MSIALGVEYDGRRFHGWQRQQGLRTVQQSIEEALVKIASHDITIHCAGRTDTGVHATNQVIHFETTAVRHLRAWVYGVNAQLPKDITIQWAKVVPEDFHARYRAMSRHYRYVIYNHPIRPSLLDGLVTWQYRPLNVVDMNQAGQSFIGEHDFTSVRAMACQSNTPIREVTELAVSRRGDLVIIDIKANAFLHHMVRNIAGILISIGSGKRAVSWSKQVLDARDRTVGAETAPPYGLYFVNVAYPDEYKLPSVTPGPMFLMGG